MKNLHFAVLVTLLVNPSAWATTSGRPDVYTTRIMKVKSDVSFEQAKQNFDALNAVLGKLKGFEKRNLFFDKEQKTWIDQIKWKHSDAATAGVKSLEKDSAFEKVIKMMEVSPAPLLQSERVMEFDAPK